MHFKAALIPHGFASLFLSLFFSFSHTGLINEPNARSYRRKPSCPTFEWLARSCPIKYDPIRPPFINRRIDIAHALERGFALLFSSRADCSRMKYLPGDKIFAFSPVAKAELLRGTSRWNFYMATRVQRGS